MLSIEKSAEYSELITGMEFHSHKPYASNTFKCSDEIRIPISTQDIITAPFESTIHITGTVSGKTAGNTNAKIALVNNAIAFLFEDIRYEIGGVEVDRVKNVGITTTIKGLLSTRQDELLHLQNGCWFGAGKTNEVTQFTFSVPLSKLMGFAEDYKRIIVNVRQELILLRSASDYNALVSDDATSVTLNITGLYWRIPHISLADEIKLQLFRKVEKDFPVHIPFRSWELHEYPTLPMTNRQSWTIKTSSQMEKPRFVVLAFQTDRKNKIKANASNFDSCDLTDIKLYLNSTYYPYDNIRGDYCIFYEMFTSFQKSYYEKNNISSTVDFETFKATTPLYVIDCSKQVDNLKSGPVDVRLEFEAKQNFPDKTAAYCLLLHDSHLVYTLLTGSVKKIM
jgi:hypothetical protein